MGILDRIVIATLPVVPRPVMRRLSARYIAGERLVEAIERLRGFTEQGYGGVLDILGEDVATESKARNVLSDYKKSATALAEAELDAYVSVKPTHFGLRISKELCHELYSDLLDHCQSLGQMARVEMEDASTTDDTLELFAKLRTSHDNVGIVLQARLFRTLTDIDSLPPASDVRIVKGIYLEPAQIAHTEPQPIRDAFVACTEKLFAGGHTAALATHDEHLAARLLRLASDKGVPLESYYFEVLLGVHQELWKRWKEAGHLVRVYVPFGPEWRAYSQRRLRKNPEVLGHVMRNLFRR